MNEKQENVELQEFSMDDFVTTSNTTSKIDQSAFNEVQHKPAPPIVPNNATEHTEQTKCTSSKQRKASLEEYRELFLQTPKIIDRQPVFISRELRDKVDEIVRRLGERKMSVSGFIQNLASHHLESYKEEVERWKRL